MEYDADCDADLILGYDCARTASPSCTTPTRCASARSATALRAAGSAASPATRLSLAEARELLGAVGLGPASTLGLPSQWS